MADRIKNATSPYLEQHAHQEIDWWPWGEEAFEQAKKEKKLVFLSIGYSSCHWCHVMSHESFDHAEVAAQLNAHFIAIKVDREEHPNVDAAYMSFVQATLGQGGWPMSLWLTPEGLPVVGGTYFPREDREGRAGFHRVCAEIQELWEQDPERIFAAGKNAIEQLQEQAFQQEETQQWDGPSISKRLYESSLNSFDPVYGGFGNAPKFPQVSYLLSLFSVMKFLTEEEKEKASLMLEHTLKMMARGGIFDQVGGGFHRYSVDQYWHIPHFEKMLYDQAQLISLYTQSYHHFGNQEDSRVVAKTIDYVLSCLKDPCGGYHSAEDADSDDAFTGDHLEGAFWTWRYSEIIELLGERAVAFCQSYRISEEGNAPAGSDPHGELKGRNTLIFRSEEDPRSWDPELEILRAQRAQRTPPFRDDKCLTSWNAILAKSLLEAGRVFQREDWKREGEQILDWIYQELWDGTSLSRGMRGTRKMGAGQAIDYAHVLLASLESDSPRDSMEDLQQALETHFWSDQIQGFATQLEIGGETLLTFKEDYDGAEPSVQSVMAQYYAKKGEMEKLHAILNSASVALIQNPVAVAGLIPVVVALS